MIQHIKIYFAKTFSHPAFISFIIALAIILLIPPIFDKYEAELIEKRLLEGNDRIYYCDLDYDGKSERIHLANNTKSGIPIIICYDDKGLLIHDWTLPEPWIFWSDLFFADFNNDGLKEVIVFTQKEDSVFINGYTVYPELKKLFRKYVDQIYTYQGNYHSEIWNGKAIDVDDDGVKELYFVINSGYSKQPRNVYVYYPVNDSIAKSPTSGSSIHNPPIFADIDNDGLDEILLSSYASGNIKDANFPFYDSSSWLIALDLNLKYFFKPVEFKNYTTSVIPVPIKFDDITYIAFRNKKQRNYESKKTDCIFLVNNLGQIIVEKEVKSDLKFGLTALETKKGHKLYQILQNGEFRELNRDLEIVKKRKSLSMNGKFLSKMDIDHDSYDELVLISKDQQQLYVLRNEINHPVVMDIPNRIGTVTLSFKKNLKANADISIQVGQNWYLFKYNDNPIYAFRWIIYASIWILLFLFIAFLKKIYQDQVYKKHRNEQRIAELQVQSVKNQMTPHFMFNVLNVITNNLILKKQEEANTYLVKFSKLLRSLYMGAEDLTISLKDELEFISNYLDLQKIRFKDELEYEIKLDSHVNSNTQIPRMLIQLFVENSIKHGFETKSGKGIISIVITNEKDNITICVQDNGIGRNQQNDLLEKSGKGRKIIDEMIMLNYRLNNQRIRYRYEDLFDDKNKPSGTKVWVTIIN